ncbi:MAG: hypothetical protein J6O50_08625 [Ruminiclostridium sp.]|nr:hypothetical protein [Ruminiclostridium sp.]
MNKTGFIMQLAERLNITEEQAALVDGIVEAHPIIGKNSKLAVIAEIKEKLGTDDETAKQISDTVSELIGSNIRNKLLHPFGGNDEDK